MRNTAARLLVLCAMSGVGESEAQVNGGVGLGVGLPYGSPLPGLGVELEMGRHFSVLSGVGLAGSGTPWSYGVKFYLTPADRTLRPYVSALRWTEGTGVFLGALHDVGKGGGFHLNYGVGFGDVQLEGRVALMAGFGYRF